MLAERWSHAVGELTPVLTRDTEIDVLLSGGTLVERLHAQVASAI
jgi:hypothetical protein